MTRATFLQLYDACSKIAKSGYVKARTSILLSLFYDSGARRKEIASITVNDARDAIRRSDGKLELKSAKRTDDHRRKVPIPAETLREIEAFISVSRAAQVRKLVSLGLIDKDPGWLFMSSRGGRIGVETITQDFHRLRRAAGIKGRAAPHMLRHRWITVQVAHQLRGYLKSGKKLPPDIRLTLLTKVASLAGQRHIASMRPYLDLSTEELGIWADGEAVLNQQQAKDAQERAEMRQQKK